MQSAKEMCALQEAQPWSPRTVGIALAAYQPNPIWFAEQLESIAAQTHSEWICVVTLDSPLRDIQDHPRIKPFFGDSRFNWIENEERLGARGNFEKAITLATAKSVDLIAFADQDDIWLPEKISEGITAIKISGPMSVVASDSYLFSGDFTMSETLYSLHRIVKTELTLEEMVIYPSVTGFTMVVDAQLAKLHPSIPESVRFHDHWFALVGTAYRGVTHLDKPLAFYRQHENNTIGIRDIRLELGLPMLKATTSTTEPVRELGRRHRAVAHEAANQLPMSLMKRVLFRSRFGWMLMLLTIIIRRSFIERRLVAQAHRALVAQLLVFPSQVERGASLRSRIPIKNRLLPRIALVAGAVALGVTVLFAEVIVDLVMVVAAPLWFAFGAAALLGPAWKLARHRYLDGGQSLIGVSAVFAGLVRLLTSSPGASVLTFALPVAWYLAYRIRWRGDTGL
jgi:hypothetical protein